MLSVTNNFLNQGKYQQKKGSFKVGTSRDINHSATLGNGKIVFNVGSSYTQGNQVRSLYDTNDNGPLLYNKTTKDIESVLTKFSSIFIVFHNLKDFPYLYPLSNTWNSQQTITNSQSWPIFRYSGKGLGKIEFYNTGSLQLGNFAEGYPSYLEHYSNHLVRGQLPLLSAPRNINGPTFPYSGLIYSGNLLQYNTEKVDSYSNVKVIPYQAGRGIPQWDHTKEYFGGAPFGAPTWTNTDITIEPQLSHGVGTSNNDFCVGVSLDTQTEKPKVYNTNNDHPAPFTKAPSDISYTKVQKIYSPGPNLSDTYWAPWPEYYAYKDNEPVPVLVNGKVTLKIGAACNIGMQAYYEPDVAEGDDPVGNKNYVSVSCVPLFQGEKIKVGSECFSSCMGQVITWDRKGVSPYPCASYVNCSGSKIELPSSANPVGTYFRESREENPWYDYCDPSFGATGWTSTPAFLLSGIPDQGKAIIESKNTPLPYMVQSNQGSVIVQAQTTVDSLSSEGSGRSSLLGPAKYSKAQSGESCHNFKFEKIKGYPATPGRTQTIGTTMQEIEGSGQWPYTGSFAFNPQEFNVCGLGYTTGVYYTRSTSTGSTSTGSGCLVEVTSVDANGSITGVSTKYAGQGYQDGDILTLVNGTNFGKGTIQVKNTGTVVWNAGVVSIHYRGSRYENGFNVVGYNLTKNNLVMSLTVTLAENSHGRVSSYSVDSFGDASQYPVGTTFYAMNRETSEKYTKSGPLAIFTVTSNDGVNIGVDLFSGYFRGDDMAYPIGTFLYSTQKLDTVGPSMTIKTSGGAVNEIKYTDVGVGNTDGDLILVQEGDENVIVSFNSSLNSLQLGARLIKGGAGYVFNQKSSVTWITYNNNVKINNPGQVWSNIEMYLSNTTEQGTINKLTYNSSNGFTQFTPLQPDLTAYTGSFGDIQTVEQTVPVIVATQPVAGAQPAGGWPSFVKVSNATFLQKIDFRVVEKGSGYTAENVYATTGGSGAGLTVVVTKVDENGGIEELKCYSFGTGYKYNDTVTITGGTAEVVLKLPKTQRVRIFESYDFFANAYVPQIFYDFEVISAGSGYTVGGPYDTVCNNRYGVDMKINVLKVDGSGGIQDIEIFQNTNDKNCNYLIGYNIVVQSGDSNAVIQLKNPIKTQPIEFTKQGTGYTTSTGVSTYNLTQNNLYTICGLETLGAGTCEVISYGALDEKPPRWNLSRYSVGDTIAFSQNNNQTATAEILTIDPLTQEITFNQLTPGTGYVQPATPYGFLPTVNLSNNATTIDITADVNGQITEVQINTLGDNVEAGDMLLIQSGDYNAVIQVCPLRDVPPEWQQSLNGTKATPQQWNDYKTVMKNSLNLLDYPLFVDFYNNYPNYMNVSYYSYGDEGVTNEWNYGFIEPDGI